jgi:hypothetical protein
MNNEFWLGLLLAIPLGILTNLATPWIKSIFEKGNLSLRERRVYLIKKRFEKVKFFHENPNRLHFVNARITLAGLLSILVGLGVIGLSIFLVLETVYYGYVTTMNFVSVLFGGAAMVYFINEAFENNNDITYYIVN